MIWSNQSIKSKLKGINLDHLKNLRVLTSKQASAISSLRSPSALPFEPSYTALKSLRQKVSNYTTTSVTLPHRPKNLSTDLHPYLNNAIVTLSTSTAYLVVEVKKGVERVDTKVDEVKAEVAEVNKKVDEVNKKVNEVDKKVAEIKTEVAEDGDCYRYIVAKGFPNRVKDFWRLISNPKTLTDLVRHYLKRATLRDTNVSYYIELEDTVTAHLYKCLRALAIIWGLQYSLGKRKAETDNGLRRDNDSITGSESTSSQNLSRVISVQIRVPSNTERRDLVKLLMVAKREDLRRRSPKIRSTPSTKQRRNWMRYSDVSSPEPTRPFSTPGLGPT
ncbi:hypothetical protein V2W45_1495155 [Cenococcum geophilum]